MRCLDNNLTLTFYKRSFHSNFSTYGTQRDLLSVQFAMLRTCKTKTTNVHVTSSSGSSRNFSSLSNIRAT